MGEMVPTIPLVATGRVYYLVQVAHEIVVVRGCARGAGSEVINFVPAVCCTSVTPPTCSCRTFSRARGVFIFVRNFSRGIFLRGSISKVATAARALQLLLL